MTTNTPHTHEHGPEQIESGVYPIKAWTRGVHVDPNAFRQLQNTARLPIIHGWVAAMPDVHWGIGATVGSVIPTRKAIIPAAVGVDIGCGMMAARTSLRAEDLPDSLREVRSAIEAAVPHGRHRGELRVVEPEARDLAVAAETAERRREAVSGPVE